jgi:hypothetical protein
MSYQTAIFALLLYPLLSSLSFNWVRFRWGLRRGLAPASPEVEDRAREVDRILATASQVVLLIAVVWLLRSSSLRLSDVGLTLANWKRALFFGLLLSLFPFVLGSLARLNPRFGPRPVEPAGLMWGRIFLGAISNEMWRAFCIAALIQLNIVAGFAVVIAAAAGALTQLRKTARFLGAFTFGILAGFLFTSTHSLIAPLAMAILGALGPDWVGRRALSTIRPLHKCPVCSALIEDANATRRPFECPGCDSKLNYSPKPWVIQVLNFSVLPLTALMLYEINVGLIWGLILFFPVDLIVFFSLVLIFPVLAPSLCALQAERSRFQALELRWR